MPPGPHANAPHPVLAALQAVHRELAGAPVQVCEEALAFELRRRGIPFERNVPTELWYRGTCLSTRPAVSFVLADGPLDVRCVDRLMAADERHTLHHLRARGGGMGLVVNFGGPRLQVRRVHASAMPGDPLHGPAGASGGSPSLAPEDPGVAGA